MSTVADTYQESIRPPAPPGPVKWLQDNLFSGWLNTLMTLLSLAVLYFLLMIAMTWGFFKADWRPVTQAPLLYLVGQYPREELWRVGVSFSLFVFLIGASWGRWAGMLRTISLSAMALLVFLAVLPVQHPQLGLTMRLYLGLNATLVLLLGYVTGRGQFIKSAQIILAWILAPAVTLVLLSGVEGFALLEKVATTAWGGLMVTLLLSIGGILLSFPIGVLLALGRRSSLPVVSAVSTVFIETIRGVPLITILFMFSVILTLFLPEEARLDRLLRALMAMTVFSAAYTAENVRGGLQAVPLGQIEAAKALGMGGFQTTLLIVLPQALRAVIPAIVGQFIALFKDSTLVVIVGINDFLGIGKSVINSSPEFVQLQLEVYLFIAAIYWVFSYLMSAASRKLEAALGVGTR